MLRFEAKVNLHLFAFWNKIHNIYFTLLHRRHITVCALVQSSSIFSRHDIVVALKVDTASITPSRSELILNVEASLTFICS